MAGTEGHGAGGTSGNAGNSGDGGSGGGGGFFGGGSSSSSNDGSNAGFSKGVGNPGAVAPVGRGGVSVNGYDGNRGVVSGNGMDGNGFGRTNEVGVSTNNLGAPQYGYSEVGANSGPGFKDDNNDGYSDFHDENPSSSISPQQYAIQKAASRVLGMLTGGIIGLAGSTVTDLQARGIVPSLGNGDFKGPRSGDDTVEREGQSEIDKKVNDVLNDGTLSDTEKDVQVTEILVDALQQAEGQEAAQVSASVVTPMVDQVYGNSTQTPEGIMSDPFSLMGIPMSARVRQMDTNTGLIQNPVVNNPSLYNYTADQASTSLAAQQTAKNAQGYEAALTAGRIATNGQANAVTGTVSNDAIITAEQLDAAGTATGVNSDGTTNYTGQALNRSAQQGFGQIIDTTTVSGKLLAQELGEGNFTDSKATMQGQLDILSKQFVDPTTGEPKIPTWAAGVARNVSRIAAFKGMTGTAATAAMSQALMEASLPVAQQDAQFFQTLTVTNLNNRQQMAVTKANVLAKMDMANLDSRMSAAVNNSKAFLQMDLQNLSNEQQTELVNTQARVQSILEDAKSTNAARLFTADAQNDFAKFYDQLDQQINMFNSEQQNSMNRFNVGETNSASQFNAQLENQREQFYQEMQYNVDLSNARWRQTVEVTENAQRFQAAQMDIMNVVNMSKESLNRMWDREDAILDYTWKTSDNALTRDIQRYAVDKEYELGNRKADDSADAAKGAGIYELVKIGTDLAKSFDIFD